MLLKGLITLPPHAIRNGVTSLEDLTNMLANYAMHSQQNRRFPLEKGEEISSSFLNTETQNQFSLNEFMNYIPNFQYGMDVNPKFTVGCQGYEYTAELSVLSDMLGCKLLHGWLIDPILDEATAKAAGKKSYNELVERAIMGKEAEMEVSNIQVQIEEILQEYPHIDNEVHVTNELLGDDHDGTALGVEQENLRKLRIQQCEQQNIAIEVHLIETFLADSSHQLTIYGLEQLHAIIHDREICIMFRNNHFSTIIRHSENLYLLVTDLGYAITSSVVWEKLDVVDGDTEFCDSYFICNSNIASIEEQSGPTLSPEEMMATSGQNDVDYQLAMQLSMQGDDNNAIARATASDAIYSNPSQTNIPSGTIVALPTVPNTARIEVGVPISKANTSGSDQETMDRMMALELQQEHTSMHGNESDDVASLRLARQLQEEENAQTATNASMTNNNYGTTTVSVPPSTQRIPRPVAIANSNCAIM